MFSARKALHRTPSLFQAASSSQKLSPKVGGPLFRPTRLRGWPSSEPVAGQLSKNMKQNLALSWLCLPGELVPFSARTTKQKHRTVSSTLNSLSSQCNKGWRNGSSLCLGNSRGDLRDALDLADLVGTILWKIMHGPLIIRARASTKGLLPLKRGLFLGPLKVLSHWSLVSGTIKPTNP